MKVIGYIAAFLGGAALGAGTAYILVRDKEKKRADEEIKDVREYYHQHQEKITRDVEDLKLEGEMIRETQKKLEKLKTPYEDYSDFETKEEYLAAMTSPKEDPHVYGISDEDFINGAITYDKVSLRLFMDDGTVVDENDEPVVADDMIGVENLNRLLDGDEDGLFLRDDDKEVDYEIDRVPGAYKDLIGDI